MSVSKKARRQGTILDEIMAYHRERLPKLMRQVPLSDVRALASVAPPVIDFHQALTQPGIALIAECKKASPSKGLLAPNYDPVNLARAYVEGGASAISVLTDSRHFQGSLEDLRDVKESLYDFKRLITNKADKRRTIGIPVLRKDFIFHPYQIYESRAAGADAVLLIVAVLEGGDLVELYQLARQMGMEALVEVHSEEELERALALTPGVIGINNRNLRTFQVDFENSARLRALVPDLIAVVGESGISGPADVARLKEVGVDAILVGESLVRSKDPSWAAKSLVEAGRA